MTTGPGRSSRSEEEEIRVGWKMAGIGFEVSAQVAAGALLGYFFDKWQGTTPNGVLVGGILGILVALWTFIRGALKLNRQLDQTSRPAKKNDTTNHGDNGTTNDDE